MLTRFQFLATCLFTRKMILSQLFANMKFPGACQQGCFSVTLYTSNPTLIKLVIASQYYSIMLQLLVATLWMVTATLA
jgi:hypothetical protein